MHRSTGRFRCWTLGCLLVAAVEAEAESAADSSNSRRAALLAQLHAEFPYQPPTSAEGSASPDPTGVRMDPFIVTSRKDRTGELAQIFQEQRQRELEQRPSLEGGASVERTLLGKPATIGPRPYRDLFEKDARFKMDEAITPTWNLLDLKL